MKKETQKAAPAKPAKGGGKLSTRGKVLIGSVVLVIGGVAVYLMKDKIFKKDAPLPAGTPAGAASTGTSVAPAGAGKPSNNTPIPYAPGTLVKGSKGADVTRLQEFLNTQLSVGFLFGGTKKEAANPKLSTDGIFGSQTEAELLKQFGQKAITTKQLSKWIETGEKRLAQQAV